MDNEKICVADKETQTITKYNTDIILQKLDVVARENHKRYGIRIDKNDSNPETRCKYIFDAVDMLPAKMNYATMTFDYGDWRNVFFVKKNYPCMLNSDGTEAYRLNKDDYSKKEDGTNSDVADLTFDGNAMSAIPLVWVSQYEKGNYEYMIVSDIKYDETYHAYLHTKSDGSIANVHYERMFEVSSAGFQQKLRSMSGTTPGGDHKFSTSTALARMNGEQWGLSRFASWNLFEVLLKIMSKTEDSQKAFGNGVCKRSSYLESGTLNDKGAFYGYNDTASAMKVFHCENWWGNIEEFREGLINIGGRIMIKPFPPFNLLGDGFEDIGIDYTNQKIGFESKTIMTDKGRFPKEFNGSESTFTCDQVSVVPSDTNPRGYVMTGGDFSDGNKCGCRCMSSFLGMGNIIAHASLSCEQP